MLQRAKKRPGKSFQGGNGASYRGLQAGRADYLENGSFNRICDRCGFKGKAEHIRREWTGLYTCDATINNCWEQRNAQDFVRGVPDNTAVRNPRPDKNNARIVYWPYPCIAGVAVCGLSVCGTGYIKSNNANN